MNKPIEPIRAAFVSELAFLRFCARGFDVAQSEMAASVLLDARKRLLPLLDDPATLEPKLSMAEERQISGLENNLRTFFSFREKRTVTRPLFRGCGYIDASEGDILSGTCLFEIKTVDRPFRSADIRQLITYCALNHSSRQFECESIGVFNPRRGIYFEIPIDEVSHEIAGTSGQQLFDSIIHVVSNGDISR